MTKQEILDELDDIDNALSPENLHCDGEISHAEAMKRFNELTMRQTLLRTMLKAE